MTKFKLGPLQTLWLKQLRKYPERQCVSILGKGNPRNYKACCLGELHLCAARLQKKKLPFYNGSILDPEDGEDGNKVLSRSHDKYGLYSSTGKVIKEDFETSIDSYSQLSAANDAGITWTEIADIIEVDPTNFFIKSV